MKFSHFQRRALTVNLVIWTLFIGISLSASFIDSSRAGIEVEPSKRILAYLISFGPWVFATPLFFWLLDKNQRDKHLPLPALLSLCLLCWAPVVAVGESYSYQVIRSQTQVPLWQTFTSLPLFYWVYNLILFSVINAACLSVIYYRRANANKLAAAEAEQANIALQLEMSELKIQSLLSQLEPHFLFNALNAIASLIRTAEPKPALSAVTQLSDLLRYAIEATSHKYVSLDNELNFVRDYLALQSLRFDDKLNVEINDNRQQHNQDCPPFLLQIFVENAIKHGLEDSGKPMALTIKLDDSQERYSIQVRNSHAFPEPDKTNPNGLGIGLANLRSRLAILYHDNYQFSIEKTQSCYQVTLDLPSRGDQE